MKRRFRLTRSTDFKRVRRSGKSYAHPLVVLYAAAPEQAGTHVGISAGRSVGNAVQRNRAKRLLRSAMTEILPSLLSEADLLLIARSPLAGSDLAHTRAALSSLLKNAGLLSLAYDGHNPLERVSQ